MSLSRAQERIALLGPWVRPDSEIEPAPLVFRTSRIFASRSLQPPTIFASSPRVVILRSMENTHSRTRQESAPNSSELAREVHEPTDLPYGVSRYYAALAEREDPATDPIAAQYVPRQAEHRALPYEDPDPIGDAEHQVTERLIHNYHDRALLLVNDRCAVYCRHCFRRHFTGHADGRLTDTQLDAACGYLLSKPQITELLLSGGDPLMLPDRELFHAIDRLLEVNPDYILRLCTRMPVVLPSRITTTLAQGLGKRGNVWVITHANHPRELTAEFSTSVRTLMAEGIPTLNQAVLLRGINDQVGTLEELFRGLLRIRVKPYYLFQGDLASGTAHFRIPIERGIELMESLRARLSGMAIPTYAVDLPGGGGKVPIEKALLRMERNAYVFRGPGGKEYRYPREVDSDDGVSDIEAEESSQHPVNSAQGAGVGANGEDRPEAGAEREYRPRTGTQARAEASRKPGTETQARAEASCNPRPEAQADRKPGALGPLADRLQVVLCRPDSSFNIGSVCRAMKTMGLRRLVLVPKEEWSYDAEQVRFMAVHAFDVYEAAVTHPTLAEAVAGSTLSVGFTRRRGKQRKKSFAHPEDLARRVSRTEGPIALVFGNEEHGLTTDELRQVALACTIPTAPDFPSLNLASAVQIACYVLAREAGSSAMPASSQVVPQARVERTADTATELFDAIGLFRISSPEPTRTLLRDALARAALSRSETDELEKLFHKARHMLGK